MNVITGISGAACMFLSVLLFYGSVHRPAKPAAAWTRTDGGAAATAFLVLTLFFTGITLVAKSFS